MVASNIVACLSGYRIAPYVSEVVFSALPPNTAIPLGGTSQLYMMALGCKSEVRSVCRMSTNQAELKMNDARVSILSQQCIDFYF